MTLSWPGTGTQSGPSCGRRLPVRRAALALAAACLMVAAAGCSTAAPAAVPAAGGVAGIRQIPVGVGSPPLRGTLTLPAGKGPPMIWTCG